MINKYNENDVKIGIYKITNISNTHENGKSYIGLSNNIYKRWNDHIYFKNSPQYKYYKQRKFYVALEKFGFENFKFEIICEFDKYDKNELFEAEIKYIEYYDSYKNGYNSNKGGGGGIKYENNDQNKNKSQIKYTVRQRVRNIQVSLNYKVMNNAYNGKISPFKISKMLENILKKYENNIKNRRIYDKNIDNNLHLELDEIEKLCNHKRKSQNTININININN